MFSYRRLRLAALATLSHSISKASPALSLSLTPAKSNDGGMTGGDRFGARLQQCSHRREVQDPVHAERSSC